MFSSFNKADGSGMAIQNFTVTSVSGTQQAELLLVGGGGGGGWKGGGGGAGEVVTATTDLVAQTYIVYVGTGGVGNMSPGSGTGTWGAHRPGFASYMGPPSSQNTWRAGGGGKGGSDSGSTGPKHGFDGYHGGSGGGGWWWIWDSVNVGNPTQTLHNPNGTRYNNPGGGRSGSEGPNYYGGGGGGASGAGQASGQSGAGGLGLLIPSFRMYGTTVNNALDGSENRGYFGGGGGGGGDTVLVVQVQEVVVALVLLVVVVGQVLLHHNLELVGKRPNVQEVE